VGESAIGPGWRKSSHSGNGGSGCVEVGVWRKASYSGNGGEGCVEVNAWRKSSHSGNGGGNCVEVGGDAVAGVLIRDTTNRAGAVLTVPAGAWRALLADVRATHS
jgi:hypothetical protein